MTTGFGGSRPVDGGTPNRSRFGPRRDELWAFLELWAIAGLAITQPALDLLAKNLGIFVAQEASPSQVVAVCLVILFVPAGIAYAGEVALGLAAPSLRPWVHAALIGGFFGLFVEQVVKHSFGGGPGVPIGLGAAGGLLGVALVRTAPLARLFLRYLAVVPLILAVAFLGFSPAKSLVFTGQPKGLSGVTIGSPKRVVMIVLDELPLQTLLDGNGHVDAELYPNFAQLATTSTWYRNMTTVDGFTKWAVPALVNAQYPKNPGALANAADYPDTIFRLLGGAYRMNVHESITNLCPTNVCVGASRTGGWASNVSRLLDQAKDLWGEFADPYPNPPTPLTLPGERIGTAQAFIRSLAPSALPTFDFLHLLLPHQPWRYLPTLQDAGFSSDDFSLRVANDAGWGSQWAAALGRERHVLQVQAVDAILGRIVERLHQIRAWDDAVVVVTADHGAGFTVGEPIRWIAEKNAAEILWTPLFVKAPNHRSGVVDDRPVQSIDVLPTIAELLDVEIPWRVDGVSALGRPRPDFPRRFAQWDRAAPDPPSGAPLADDGRLLSFDSGLFAKVLAAEPVSSGPDPLLRPYRIGPYADLLGRAPNPMVDPQAPGPASISIGDTARFENVDPLSGPAPWSWIEGRAVDGDSDQALAFAVNGHIAGLTAIDERGSGTAGYYFVALAPSFFSPGANEVKVYAISGSPDRPVLKEVPRDAARPGSPGDRGR